MICVYPAVFDCIDAAAERAVSFGNGLEKKTLIFCEDKLTLSVEQALCEKAGGSFNTEVLSFGRFLQKYAPYTPSLSKEGGAMAVKKILSENAEKLTALKNSASPSLAAKLYELIAQLKSAKVTPDALFGCNEDCPQNIGAKVKDIALIYDKYERFLSERGLTDGNNSLKTLPEIIRSSEVVRGARVIITAFSSVTEQICDVIKALYERAESCDFYCTGGENPSVYNEEFLHFVKSFTGEQESCGESLASNEGLYLVSRLFDAAKLAKEGKHSDKVSVYEAKNTVEEARSVAARIRYEVVSGGRKYRDFAVAVGGLATCASVYKSALKEYGIPFFADEKRKLSEHPLVRLMDATIKFRERSDISELKKVISSGLFIPEKQIADKTLKTVTEKALTVKAFTSKDAPYDFGDIYINAKCAAISRLTELFPKTAAINEYTKNTRAYLEEIGAWDNSKRLCERLVALGEAEEARYGEEGNEKFLGILEEIEGVLDRQEVTLEEYRKILLSGAEESEISVIPEKYDCVYLSELKNCRFKKYKVLFAAGLSAEIPTVKADVALLRDSDIKRLEELKVKVEPKIRVVNKREREAVALALLSFEDRLFLSYSLTSPTGKKTPKSDLIDQVSAAFSDKTGKLLPYSRLSFEIAKKNSDGERKDILEAYDYLAVRPGLKSLAATADDFKSGADDDTTGLACFYAALKNTGDEENLSRAEDLLGRASKKSVTFCDLPTENYFQSGNVSASALETYYACPYKGFAKYGVRLKEELTPEVRSLDFGNILHSVAELFVKDIELIDGEEAAAKRAEEIFDQISQDENYKKFLHRADYEFSFSLLKREAIKLCVNLYAEYVRSDFRPVGTEVWFSDGGKYRALPLATKKSGYRLFGKVDRIDKFDDFVRIIDYKTGNAESKIKDEKFYVGLNMQLYLYMNAFAVDGAKAAGAYYYALNDNFVPSDKKVLSMYGKTLSDEKIITATDKEVAEKGESEIADLKVNASGKGSAYKGNLADERTIKGYMKYAKLMAEAGVNDIIDGFIAATPYEGECAYCEYSPLCRYDKECENKTRKATGINSETIVSAAEEEYGK
ncbi:MAG: PD-(D/E)XK nuclease family protein [Clostridia bacterium]|nr:PD-(D/E)XK nuclease family protein [Clostridia bacterium]